MRSEYCNIMSAAIMKCFEMDARQVRGIQCAEATSLACMSGIGASGEVCKNTTEKMIRESF
jgi:hypothetical protein